MEITRSRYDMMARISWIAPLAVLALIVVISILPIPFSGIVVQLAAPVLALVGMVAGLVALVGIRKVGWRLWPAIPGIAISALILLIWIFLVRASGDYKEMISLESGEGQALFQGHDAPDYLPLKTNWVAQLRMHCYAASAVIVMNSLQPGKNYTQNNLFIPETAHIITQDEVFRGKFTLEKLADIINTRSGLKTEYYHAGLGKSEYDYSKFLEHLKENRKSPNDHMIITYSLMSVRGRGTGGGHASPVADYNEEKDMVLMLEVKGNAKPFWISSKDIYTAMNTIDPVCDRHRGWIIVRK